MYDCLLIHIFERILILYKFRKICTCLSIAIHLSCSYAKKENFPTTFQLGVAENCEKFKRSFLRCQQWRRLRTFYTESSTGINLQFIPWHTRTHAHTHAGKKNDLNFFFPFLSNAFALLYYTIYFLSDSEQVSRRLYIKYKCVSVWYIYTHEVIMFPCMNISNTFHRASLSPRLWWMGLFAITRHHRSCKPSSLLNLFYCFVVFSPADLF